MIMVEPDSESTKGVIAELGDGGGGAGRSGADLTGSGGHDARKPSSQCLTIGRWLPLTLATCESKQNHESENVSDS